MDEPSSDSEDSAPFPVSVQKLLEAKASIPVEHSLIPHKASPFADMFSALSWFSASSARTHSYSTPSLRFCPAIPRCIQRLSGAASSNYCGPIDPAPALCRSHSDACLSSTGSSLIYKRPHLSALCFEAYHAAHAGKIDVIQANLLPFPGIVFNYSDDAIFFAAKIVEADLPNTVDQIGSLKEINNNLNIIIE